MPPAAADFERMARRDRAHWDRHGYGPLGGAGNGRGGAFVGRGGLAWATVAGERQVELPWAVSPARRNRGYATEMALAAIETAREAGLPRVVSPGPAGQPCLAKSDGRPGSGTSPRSSTSACRTCSSSWTSGSPYSSGPRVCRAPFRVPPRHATSTVAHSHRNCPGPAGQLGAGHHHCIVIGLVLLDLARGLGRGSSGSGSDSPGSARPIRHSRFDRRAPGSQGPSRSSVAEPPG